MRVESLPPKRPLTGPERGSTTRLGPEVSVRYLLHVPSRFAVCRNAAAQIDGALAGIICRERLGQIAVIAIEQRLQVRSATLDVLDRVKRIAYAKALRGCRDELHQANRSFLRNGPRVPSRLSADHGLDERRIES